MTQQADSWHHMRMQAKERQVSNMKEQVKTESRVPQSSTNKMQDAGEQKYCNANNTAEPGVDANVMVMGNNNNSIKSFLSEQIREDDVKTHVKQSNQRNNINDNESFICKAI